MAGGAPTATDLSAAAQPVPAAGNAADDSEFKQQVVRALMAHDRELNDMKQATQIDLLLVDEKLKQDAFDLWQTTGLPDKRVSVLRTIIQRCLDDQIPGGTRLNAESDVNLGNSLLRFRPRYPESTKAGSPWKISVTFSLAATRMFLEAFSDMIAHGGNERLKIRRPLSLPGRAVTELAQNVLGKDLKGKGKGKGSKDYSGKGKHKGKGKGKAKTLQTAPPRRSASPALPTHTASAPSGRTDSDRAADRAKESAAPAMSPPPIVADPNAPQAMINSSEMTPLAPTLTYAAAVASDEGAQMMGETTTTTSKRTSDSTVAEEPGLKKSNSPNPERSTLNSPVIR